MLAARQGGASRRQTRFRRSRRRRHRRRYGVEKNVKRSFSTRVAHLSARDDVWLDGVEHLVLPDLVFCATQHRPDHRTAAKNAGKGSKRSMRDRVTTHEDTSRAGGKKGREGRRRTNTSRRERYLFVVRTRSQQRDSLGRLCGGVVLSIVVSLFGVFVSVCVPGPYSAHRPAGVGLAARRGLG